MVARHMSKFYFYCRIRLKGLLYAELDLAVIAVFLCRPNHPDLQGGYNPWFLCNTPNMYTAKGV